MAPDRGLADVLGDEVTRSAACATQGATAIATTRQAHKAERLRETGADHMVVTTAEPLIERVRQINGGCGADVMAPRRGLI